MEKRYWPLIVASIPVASACSGGADRSTALGSTSSSLVVDQDDTIVPHLPATPTFSASTVPANGDLNPYGVAFVPPGFPAGGPLHPGDILVANFNNAAVQSPPPGMSSGGMNGMSSGGMNGMSSGAMNGMSSGGMNGMSSGGMNGMSDAGTPSGNAQGTGTTIVRVNPAPGMAPTLFFKDAAAPGFDTALGVLKRGFVLVGQVPSTDGSGVCTEGPDGQEENVGQGSILVINRNGKLVHRFSNREFLDGPWDLTVKDEGSRAKVFVSDALRGSVVRLDLRIDGDGDVDDNVVLEHATTIASGYSRRCDQSAFIVGPTGLALDAKSDVLYVASTGDNKIYKIRDASDVGEDRGVGEIVVDDPVHLHGPLGLVRAANGDLISAQGDAVNADSTQPSEIVEFNAQGGFVRQRSVNSMSGGAFGLALKENGDDSFELAAVDDVLNVLDAWIVSGSK